MAACDPGCLRRRSRVATVLGEDAIGPAPLEVGADAVARLHEGHAFAEERIEKRVPTDAEREAAERVLASLSFATPLYARVDLVEGPHGEPRLLELELTEPSVFLDVDESAAARFADAIARELHQ